MKTESGWRGVLRFLRLNGESTLAEIADGLRISKGAAWTLAERCRLFSNVRKGDRGREVTYILTKQGADLVRREFKRPEAKG